MELPVCFFFSYQFTCYRPGANPWRIVNQIRSKLRIPAAAVQIPIGMEADFKGVVDLVNMKAIYNQGIKGWVLDQVYRDLSFLN